MTFFDPVAKWRLKANKKCGGSAFGGIRVYYDNDLSKNGVALSMSLICMNAQPCW